MNVEQMMEELDRDECEDVIPATRDATESEKVEEAVTKVFRLAKKGGNEFVRDAPKAIAEAMRTLGLKYRDRGLSGVDTKGMSLKARYYGKTTGEQAASEGNIERGSMVKVRSEGRGNTGAFGHYPEVQREWFLVARNELPVQWKKDKPIKDKEKRVRLLLHMHKRKSDAQRIV